LSSVPTPAPARRRARAAPAPRRPWCLARLGQEQQPSTSEARIIASATAATGGLSKEDAVEPPDSSARSARTARPCISSAGLGAWVRRAAPRGPAPRSLRDGLPQQGLVEEHAGQPGAVGSGTRAAAAAGACRCPPGAPACPLWAKAMPVDDRGRLPSCGPLEVTAASGQRALGADEEEIGADGAQALGHGAHSGLRWMKRSTCGSRTAGMMPRKLAAPISPDLPGR